MAVAPRIPREVKRGKRKPNLRRSAEHLAFVRRLPCVVCFKDGPSEAAHVRNKTDGGTGLKPSDRFTVPLCMEHHAEQHNRGELTFWGVLGVDPLNLALRLWTVSGDTLGGVRAVMRARQRMLLSSDD